MNESSKVSILIAVTDRRDMLRTCLLSVINQTYKNLEILVCDNGSASPLRSDELPEDPVDLGDGSKVSRIQWTTIPEAGIAHARNMLMDRKTGEFFFVMDSDDYLHPDCIKILVERAHATGADIVYPKIQYFKEEGKPLQSFFSSSKGDFQLMMRVKTIPHQCLYRSSTLGEYRYDEQFKSAVDYDFILNILKDGDRKIVDGGDATYYYRDHYSQEGKFMRQMDAVNAIKNKYAPILDKKRNPRQSP